MKFRLLKEETQFLKEMSKNYVSVQENMDMEIDPLFDLRSNEFVLMFFKNRGIRKPDIQENAVFRFGTVPMHVDSLYSEKYSTLIFFISGKGILSHYDTYADIRNKNVIESHVNAYTSEKHAIWLNDSLPHSYVNLSKKKTYAVLVAVSNKHLKAAKKYELEKYDPCDVEASRYIIKSN